MRKLSLVLLLLPGLLLAPVSRSQSAQQAPAATIAGVSGRWVVVADFYGSPLYFSLELNPQGEKLTGNFDGDKLEGSVSGDAVRFLAKDDQGGTEEGKATVRGGSMSGTVVFKDANDAEHPSSHTRWHGAVADRRLQINSV